MYKQPRLFNIKELLEQFILHRKDIIVKRTIYDLKRAQERAHILEGLKIALDHLDDVVALIRRSASPGEAKNSLVEQFELTLIQAQAILDMRLQRLTGLEQEKIIEEYHKKYNLPFIILRYGSVYSERPYDNNYIYNLVKKAILENVIEHEGDGNEIREYIHAADAAKYRSGKGLEANEDKLLTSARIALTCSLSPG